MTPAIDLPLLLQQIARGRSELRLLNVYRGLPISHPARILEIADSELRIHSSRHQLACLYHQGETYLQSAGLPFPVRSQVLTLHLSRDDATLANLEIAEKSIGSRAQVRVEPDEPLVAAIRLKDSPSDFFVPLADLSAEGAGVYFEHYMFPSRLCQPGNELSMTIWLPDSPSRRKRIPTTPLAGAWTTRPFARPDMPKGQDGKVVITAPGAVVSVHPDYQLKRYRVGMHLFFKDLARTVVLHYISQRQAAIIRDLGILTEELYSRTR